MKTFIQSPFNYCPLVWMCHSRTLNNKINRLHERALRAVHKNNNLTFQELRARKKMRKCSSTKSSKDICKDVDSDYM